MMDELIRRLEGPQEELSDEATEAARKHGKLRYQQGYSIPQILFEARVLQHVLTSIIHENLFGIDLSTLVGDILEIGETLQADAEISIRVYQSQIPRSLQTSFSLLYQSPYLGVAIADENRIIDGNDALLRMIGLTRTQVTAGEIDWRENTPEKFDPSTPAQWSNFASSVHVFPTKRNTFCPMDLPCRFSLEPCALAQNLSNGRATSLRLASSGNYKLRKRR